MRDKLSGLRELGVSYPVMQAGMPGIAGPELAAAVSLAGDGMIARYSAQPSGAGSDPIRVYR